MSQATNEQNYWKAYCQLIKSSIAPQIGPNSALFFGSETVRCIPAADFIPTEVTNLGTFFLGDSLLNPSNMFYVPNRGNGFVKSVQTYLSWVDLKGSQSEGVIARYVNAQSALRAADEDLRKALAQALADWREQTAAGLTMRDFPTWAATNAAEYNAAVAVYNGAAAEVSQRAGAMNGQLAPQFNKDRSIIEAALYSQVPIMGVTMDATNIDANALGDMLKQALSGSTPKPSPVSAVYQRPAYTLQGYKAALNNWYKNFDSYKKNPQRKTVSLADGERVSLREFGFSEESGSAGFVWAPFISFGASFEESDQRETMQVENKDYKIDITLTYGDMQAFTFTTGAWDIGNPKETYPDLLDGAPDQVRDLVRPVQVLCATAVGLEVEFSGGAEKVFDSMYQHYQNINGGVRIFGLDIGLSGSQSSKDTSITHRGTWESNGGKFKVEPVDSAGWCTLLGVLGERLVEPKA